MTTFPLNGRAKRVSLAAVSTQIYYEDWQPAADRGRGGNQRTISTSAANT